MINANAEGIKAVKNFTPDIDVLGIQRYSRGAVRGSIKKTEELWGKPFYMSEFNANGPWNLPKTAWSVALDEPVTIKVSDLKCCHAAIDGATLCPGSTVFVWAHYGAVCPSCFSMLLDPHPDGPKAGKSFEHTLFTPQADAMIEHFTGRPIKGNHAPVLSKVEFDRGARSRLARPGEAMSLSLTAEDADGDKVDFVAWILRSKVCKARAVEGPIPQTSGEDAVVKAQENPGEYLLLVYAIDNKVGGSASALPFKVLTKDEERAASQGSNLRPRTRSAMEKPEKGLVVGKRFL